MDQADSLLCHFLFKAGIVGVVDIGLDRVAERV